MLWFVERIAKDDTETLLEIVLEHLSSVLLAQQNLYLVTPRHDTPHSSYSDSISTMEVYRSFPT